MILTTRGRGVKFPWNLYRPSFICRPEFILVEEASILPPKLLDPRFYRISTHLTRCSRRRKCCTERETPVVLKNVKDITISKVFTIFNLLTFDVVGYMENGDLCSGAWTDCIYNKYRLRRGRALPTTPGPLGTSKRRRWIRFTTRMLWNTP